MTRLADLHAAGSCRVEMDRPCCAFFWGDVLAVLCCAACAVLGLAACSP